MCRKAAPYLLLWRQSIWTAAAGRCHSMLGSLPLKVVQQLFPQGWLYGACPREYCIKASWSCWSSLELFQSLYFKPLTSAQEPSLPGAMTLSAFRNQNFTFSFCKRLYCAATILCSQPLSEQVLSCRFWLGSILKAHSLTRIKLFP